MSPPDIPAGSPAGAADRKAGHSVPGQEPHESTSRISSAGDGSIAGSSAPNPAVPDTLRNLGRYRILSRLGHGGMGSVWLAEDAQLQRKVALKIPQIPDDDSGEWLDRFYREARAAATIHHSHLCPVYDVGEIDGVHFLTMAYIEGEPLSAQIAQRQKPWTAADAATLMRKLALAIHVAHEHGIVHRDLKPANIMINRQGEPVIVDFGLARRADADDATLTRLGELLGTPAYMSPEQVAGELEKIGPPSDLYSLGVILFELLTGRRPYQGSVAAVLGQILRDPPPPPSNFRSDLDARIEAICIRLLSRQASDRYASGRALCDELDHYLRSVQYAENLPVPLRAPAKTIAPPKGDSAGYGLSSAPTAAAKKPKGPVVGKIAEDLGERIEALLVNGQVTEALLACQSGDEAFARTEAGADLIRRAFTSAINRKLQAGALKDAVRISSALHASVLPVESADLLAKTLSAVGRTLWKDDDPGPALQLWQKQIERFSKTRLLAEKGAIFAYNRALELEKAGKFGTAVALYKVALNYDTANELVQKRLANACLHAATSEAQAGRFEAAQKICQESLVALPGNRAIVRLRDQLKRGIFENP